MTGPAATAEAGEKGLILVLHRGALGDVILSLPFLAALPRHFNLSSLTLVGSPSILKLIGNQSFVDSVQDFGRSDWAGLYLNPPLVSERFRCFLFKHRAVVVLARGDEDEVASGLGLLGLAPVMLAPSRPPEDRGAHLVDHMFAVTGVRPLEVPTLIRPSGDGLALARQFLETNGLDSRRFFTLHPGSGSGHKNWSLDNWLSLAAEAAGRTGLVPVLLLGPAEEKLAKEINKTTGAGFVTAQGLDLPVLAGLLSLSRAHAGHDSGVTHLAAGLGVPTLALFGPTDPALWGPRGSGVKIISAGDADAPGHSWCWPTREDVGEGLLGLLE